MICEVTIIDVCRRLQIEPDKSITWPAGDEAQRRWRAEHGEEPRKELRRKTSGQGSHCFAVYPISWEPVLREIILALAFEPQRQFEMAL